MRKAPDDEAQEAFGRADHCDPEGAREGVNTADVCGKHESSEHTFFFPEIGSPFSEPCSKTRVL
jgi:hypothetical protein